MNDQLALNMDGQLALSIPTALGPNDPDDGDEGRKARGMAIAALVSITKTPLGYRVPSQSGNGSYMVSVGDTEFCSCADFEARQRFCKHVVAVEYTIRREERPDGSTVETKTFRVAVQGQDWPAYNAAQMHEQEWFGKLLRDLCDGVEQPPQRMGRPRMPLGDMVLGIGLKVYSMLSTRRAMTAVRNAGTDGLLDKAPSCTSMFRYLENPALTPVLKSLIEQSSLPLKAVETAFAVDSSGFSTRVFDRWHSHKWDKVIKEARWVKAHIIVGVTTNIITSAEVSETMGHDSPQFAPLVQATARNFQVNEVSADKAYLSKKNLHLVDDLGGTAYIPFKANSKAITHHKRDGLWERAIHFFNLNRAAFLARYHLRSNVETTFHMVKAKFGGAVRAKTPTAQVNEVLMKLLCHNIVVLIHEMHELDIDPTFGAESSFTPKVS